MREGGLGLGQEGCGWGLKRARFGFGGAVVLFFLFLFYFFFFISSFFYRRRGGSLELLGWDGADGDYGALGRNGTKLIHPWTRLGKDDEEDV